MSTLDLLQPGWVLLAGSEAWRSAAAETAAALGIPVRCLVADIDLTSAELPILPAFGLGPSGAALIRPDGYIAARFHDRSSNLTEALARSASARSTGSEPG